MQAISKARMERRALLLCDAFFGWPPSWLLPAQMWVMHCEPATVSPSHIIGFKDHMLIMLIAPKNGTGQQNSRGLPLAVCHWQFSNAEASLSHNFTLFLFGIVGSGGLLN